MKGHCHNDRPSRERAGFTLFELMAAMGAASVLMVGLSSALFIAVQAVDVSDSPHLKVLEAHALLADLYADLQFATAITEQTADAITFTIPDRDDPDTTPDTIRYAWGTHPVKPGDPLTRQYNGGDVVIVAASVHDVQFNYFAPGTVVEYVTVELTIIDDPNVFVITSIPMVNRP